MSERAYPIRKTVYLTEEDAAAVEQLAKAGGMNDTTYLRGLVKADIRARQDELEQTS